MSQESCIVNEVGALSLKFQSYAKYERARAIVLSRMNWMKPVRHDLIRAKLVNGTPMSSSKSRLIILGTFCGLILSFSSQAELRDQGLNSMMVIIDEALVQINAVDPDKKQDDEARKALLENTRASIVNLSRTLGTLSYSRLQCGEAEVLAEFTQRVQQMPENGRDAMRDAFQEGFDKSKAESKLLTVDECKRLTESRNRKEEVTEANVVEEKITKQKKKVEKPPVPVEDPKLRHLRVAELSGQLAYKRKFCTDDNVFNRDFNDFLKSVPEALLEEVKTVYWMGYKHGKRLNKNLTKEQC
mgnify:CR=1 FL=1